MDDKENTPWQYKPDEGAPPSDLPDDELDADNDAPRPKLKPVSWQAPEFVEHHHPTSWYVALLIVTILLGVGVYVMTKDLFATGTMIVLGIIVGVFAGHKPGLAQYEIARSGLSVNGKSYPYSSFKSFAVLHEGPLSSANLFPLKRFVPPVAVYFEPADEQKITEALGSYLPLEDRQLDSIDRLSRRLRL